MEIRFEQLTKNYGPQVAVDHISFTAKGGQILGFLGPNGAGKSTSMKIATGYLTPDFGTVLFDGKSILENPEDLRARIGYLPENNPLYLEMYVREYLEYAGRFFGLKGSNLKTKVNEMVELTGLEPEKHKKIGALSKGYRQRTGLAQALIHNPDFLFLDEPTSGLDPNQILEIRELIKNLGKEKTVILSTHIMQEVQAICDRAVIIDKGVIVANDSVEDIKKRSEGNRILEIKFSGTPDLEKIKSTKGVVDAKKVDAENLEIKFEDALDIRSDIFDLAKDGNWKILEMKESERSLEAVFHQLTAK